MLVDNLDDGELRDLLRRVEDLERGTPLNNAAIGRSGLTVYDGGVITIENGGLSITGTAEVIGQLIGSGALTWTGEVGFTGQTNLDGPTKIDGDTTINGDVDMTGIITITGPMNVLGDVDITKTLDITGLVRLFDSMTVETGGKITVGGMTLSKTTVGGGIAFSNGGVVAAEGGSVAMYSGTGYVGASTAYATLTYGVNNVTVNDSRTTVVGNLHVTGTSSAEGAKTFRINHPTKPGRLLLHGATESPVSGIEYWGEGVLDAGGEGRIDLPDYFDALAKPEGRMALVTGRGFAADWSDIDLDTFTVAGKPHGKFSWLVKAERIGGDFEVEPVGEEAPQENSGQYIAAAQ